MYGQHSVALLQNELTVSSQQLAQRQARLNSAGANFAPRKKSPELAQQLAAAELALASLHKVSSVLKLGAIGNTAGYADYFRALARQRVAGVWLTGVSIVGAGNEIALQGAALQPALVPAYIGRLGREPVLHGKRFASLHIEQAMGTPNQDGAVAAMPASTVTFRLHSVAGAER